MSSKEWIENHKEEIKRWKRDYYHRNKETEKAKIKKRKQEWKKWWKEYKKLLKCNRCPENDWRTLDFHHKNRKTKFLEVSVMVHRGFSKKNILTEIDKCEVICSNCHRRETIKE